MAKSAPVAISKYSWRSASAGPQNPLRRAKCSEWMSKDDYFLPSADQSLFRPRNVGLPNTRT
jgi:hypothetical protein